LIECISITQQKDALILVSCLRTSLRVPASDTAAPIRIPLLGSSIPFVTHAGAMFELIWDGIVEKVYKILWIESETTAMDSEPSIIASENCNSSLTAELCEIPGCWGLAARRRDGRVGLMTWQGCHQQVWIERKKVPLFDLVVLTSIFSCR